MNETKSTRARTAIRKAASEPPALFVSLQNSTVQKVEPMDQSERSDCDRLSRDITGLLKNISAGEDVDPLLIVMCCEIVPPSVGEWYDDVLRAMQYTEPVVCRPWNRMNAGLVASTANEVCSLLLRSFCLKLMPARPVFFGPSKTFQEAAELFDAYLAAEEDSFWYRFETICASANFSQWLTVAAMADRERATMLEPSTVPQKLVTVNEVAEMLVDVEAKTLLNSDVKKWGPSDGTVNRSRAWNLDRIRPIIEKTRQFKDV